MYDVVLVLQAAVALLAGIFIVRAKSFSMYHPAVIYYMFHVLVFVIRPFLAYYGEYDTGLYMLYGFSPSEETKIMSLFVSSFGLIVFTFFCLRAGWSPVHFMSPPKIDYEIKRTSRSFMIILLVLAPLAVWSALHDRGTAAGLDTGMTFNEATGHSLNTNRNGYATDAQMLAIPLCALVAYFYRYRIVSFVPLVTFVALNLGVSKRGPLIAAVLAFSLLYAYQKRLKFPNMRMVALLILTVVVFRISGDARTATFSHIISGEVETTEQQENSGPLESMDYAGNLFLEYIIDVVPDKSGTFDYFADNLEVFTAPIPRVMWKDKPDGSPIVRVDLFRYGYPIGMTKSIPGEGWFAFGWLGVALWCGLAGHLLGILYQRFASGRGTLYEALGYLSFLASLVIVYRNGEIPTLARQCLWVLLPVVLASWLGRRLGSPPPYEIAMSLLRQRQAKELVPSTSASQAEDRRARTLPPPVRRRRKMLAEWAKEGGGT